MKKSLSAILLIFTILFAVSANNFHNTKLFKVAPGSCRVNTPEFDDGPVDPQQMDHSDDNNKKDGTLFDPCNKDILDNRAPETFRKPQVQTKTPEMIEAERQEAIQHAIHVELLKERELLHNDTVVVDSYKVVGNQIFINFKYYDLTKKQDFINTAKVNDISNPTEIIISRNPAPVKQGTQRDVQVRDNKVEDTTDRNIESLDDSANYTNPLVIDVYKNLIILYLIGIASVLAITATVIYKILAKSVFKNNKPKKEEIDELQS